MDIRLYEIIYDLTEDIKAAPTPEARGEDSRRAEVRQVFQVSKAGSVAGCMDLRHHPQQSGPAPA